MKNDSFRLYSALRILVIGAIGFLSNFGTSLESVAADQQPNILLIVSEDNGPELGCYGEPGVKTPVLDKLAAEGLRFDRAYVPQAGCSQSRAALLTGLYPHQNGQIGLATWKFALYDPEMPNVVRSLKNTGYRTGILGKLHINPESAFPFDFHEIRSANFGRNRLGEYAEKAAEFINASDKPFFLSVNYPDAHRPFITKVAGLPEEPLTSSEVKPLAYFGLDSPHLRRETAGYYNCMSRLDSQIGDLLEVLKESGKAENTLIVYMGDHGADLLRGKRTSYEGGVRVPLILHWPGKIESGQVSQDLVSTLDLTPTFLECAGADPIRDLPGRSLLELIRKERTTNWRRYLFTEYHTHSAHNFFPQRTVRDERFKLIHNLMPGEINPGYEFTRRKFFEEMNDVVAAAPEPIKGAYERMKQPPEFELYDLKVDPAEFVNLSELPEHSNTLSRLKKELKTWRKETADPLLVEKNIRLLKSEIDGCFDGKDASKARLKLNYDRYFFEAAEAESKKNVLFISIDDLRPALKCYGDETAVTPNIDRLAARGTFFSRAYCQQAVCAPSRLSLMSGRRPDTIKVWDLGTHFRKAVPDVVTLPQHFKDNGYHTRSIGKIYHGSGPASKDPSSWSEEPVFDTNHDPMLRYSTEANRNGKGLKRSASESAAVSDDQYIDGLICEEAITALNTFEESGQPFFLAVGFKKPHLPFCAPTKYWDLYDHSAIPMPRNPTHPEGAPELATRSWKELEGYTDIPKDGNLSAGKMRELRHGYYACVSYIDTQVGRLLDELDKSGLSDHTVICLWGDHGFHLGEQGIWTKSNNFELSTRVPLIVVNPDAEKTGMKSDALVELVDLYPTLSDLCGLKIPSGLEGISLVPLLEKPETAWKSAAFSQFPRSQNGTKNRHKGHGDIMGYSARTDQFRYVEWRNLDSGAIEAQELYDLRQSREESVNIASEPAMVNEVAKHAEIVKSGWKGALPRRPVKISTTKEK